MPREIASIDLFIVEPGTFVCGLRHGQEASLLSPKRAAPAQLAKALRGRPSFDASAGMEAEAH